MTSSGIWQGGRIHELDPEECWVLLESQEIGRVAWSGPEGVSVLPVNFTVVQRAVWIRTSAYSSLATEADGRHVAFEVDELDAFTRSGWSVLVRGVARPVWGTEEKPTDWEPADPWPAGGRRLDVTIEPSGITGRRVMPS